MSAFSTVIPSGAVHFLGQSFYAILGSNPPQIAIVGLMKHAFFNVKFSGEWHTKNQGKSKHWNISKFCNL